MNSTFPDTEILVRDVAIDAELGEWFRAFWSRRLARARGDYGRVAGAMRKQGIPLDIARALLFLVPVRG